jgi:hypothetical protein
MDIFTEKMSDVPEQKPVKVAQSVSEKTENSIPAMFGDFGARSVQHVERPRYGHKV